MLKYIRNEKGGGEILSFLVVVPFLVWMFTYIIFGGLFFIEITQLSIIVNKKLDIALVEGQFSTELRDNMIQELNEKGYKQENLVIDITPLYAGDNNNSNYAIRGQEISIKVVCQQVHPFYYINFCLSEKESFYLKTRVTGMSEKW